MITHLLRQSLLRLKSSILNKKKLLRLLTLQRSNRSFMSLSLKVSQWSRQKLKKWCRLKLHKKRSLNRSSKSLQSLMLFPRSLRTRTLSKSRKKRTNKCTLSTLLLSLLFKAKSPYPQLNSQNLSP